MRQSSRVDAADLHRLREYKHSVSCDFPVGFHEKYEVGQELGRGGFGVVRSAKRRNTSKEYAVKSIRKVGPEALPTYCRTSAPVKGQRGGAIQVLDVPNLSIDRQAAHLANIKREAAVLFRLRGTLNVVQIKEALEDDEEVHLVMELCRGGELSHSLGKRHFSEKTVHDACTGPRGCMAGVTHAQPMRLPHRCAAMCVPCCAHSHSATRTASSTATSSPATSCC